MSASPTLTTPDTSTPSSVSPFLGPETGVSVGPPGGVEEGRERSVETTRAGSPEGRVADSDVEGGRGDARLSVPDSTSVPVTG